MCTVVPGTSPSVLDRLASIVLYIIEVLEGLNFLFLSLLQYLGDGVLMWLVCAAVL